MILSRCLFFCCGCRTLLHGVAPCFFFWRKSLDLFRSSVAMFRPFTTWLVIHKGIRPSFLGRRWKLANKVLV